MDMTRKTIKLHKRDNTKYSFIIGHLLFWMGFLSAYNTFITADLTGKSSSMPLIFLIPGLTLLIIHRISNNN